MKAICLLLCIALARDGAGHIFRQNRHNPEMDSLYVQNTAYFEPHQRNADNNMEVEQNQKQYDRYYHNSRSNEQQRYQPNYASSQKNNDNSRSSDDNSRSNEEQRYQSFAQQLNQEASRRQQYDSQNDQQSKQYQYQGQHNQLYPQSQQLYSKLQKQQHKQKQRYQEGAINMRTNQQSYEATSSESNSNEYVRDKRHPKPVHYDSSAPTTQWISQQKQNKKPVSGDSIAWRGVQIATGPKFSVQKDDIEKIFKDAYKTMNHVSEENKIIFHHALEEATKSGGEDVHLNATELLNKNHYGVETHTIKTDDGYHLTLFRIAPKQQIAQRPVVFLMHGLLGSADDWLLMGPGKSLAYLLADAGYDVWLGNARGSKYARRHVTKHPAQKDFWQYSNDEIALHDLPTMIDYVLKTSNQEKLYYIGHSQGTTAFFALASSRPEYNNKIIMMYALSPMVYMSNARSPLLRMIAPTSRFSQKLHEQLGHGQFKPSSELVNTLGGSMCENEIGCKNVCSNVNFVMSGGNVEDMDVKLIPVIMGHLPAGASTRQMKQYAQAVASHQFTKYDYGSEINQKVYGSRQPPQYQMQKVQVPVALYYSEDDWLASPEDVAKLERELPNVKDSYKVPETHFNHMDFQFSKKAPEVIYKRLIESIQKQDQQNYVY